MQTRRLRCSITGAVVAIAVIVATPLVAGAENPHHYHELSIQAVPIGSPPTTCDVTAVFTFSGYRQFDHGTLTITDVFTTTAPVEFTTETSQPITQEITTGYQSNYSNGIFYTTVKLYNSHGRLLDEFRADVPNTSQQPDHCDSNIL